MRNYAVGLICFVVISSIAAVVYVQYATPDEGRKLTIVEGFRPFASFRGSDGPGSVFRQSPDGEIRKVTTLDVKPEIAPEVTFEVSATRRFNAEQFLKLAGNGGCEPVSGKLNLAANGEVTVKSVNGQREFTYDTQIDPQLKRLVEMFKAGELVFRETDTYWVIRETIKTSEISYTSQRGWLASANAEAALKNCVDSAKDTDAKVTLNLDSNEVVRLEKQFAEPLRGWYIADPIKIEMPFGAGPGTPPEITLEKATVGALEKLSL